MKKFFILASAAIVALASCSKTQVVYNDAPEEISFKKITNVMTKGTLYDPSSTFADAMGVYADIVGGDSYFTNAQFEQETEVVDDKTQGTGVWSGDKYWPLSDQLVFTLYAPYDGTEQAAGSVSYENNVLTIDVDKDQQIDWLYGTTQPYGKKTTVSTTMDVTLAHALSQIVVDVIPATGVTVKSITLLKAVLSNTGTITYTDYVAGEIDWEDKATAEDETPLTDAAPLLVIPGTIDPLTKVQLKYTLEGSATELTYTTDSGLLGSKWLAGSKYTYNFTIGAKEIKFEPIVTEWVVDDDLVADGNNTTDKEI